MVDFVDRDLEAYGDFNSVEGFNDKTSSARWCLPSGYRHALYTDHGFVDLLTTLDGDGTSRERNVTSDETSSARFEGQTESGWLPVIRRSLRDGIGGPLAPSQIPYLLAGTHDVPPGSGLTVLGGATVLFMPDARLIVDGALTIDGREEAIRLASAQDRGTGMRIESQLVVRDGAGIRMR